MGSKSFVKGIPLSKEDPSGEGFQLQLPPIWTDGRIGRALVGEGWMLDKDIGVSGGEDTSSAVSTLFGTSNGFEPCDITVLKPLEGMEKLRGTV